MSAQRRTVRVLVASQVLGGVGVGAGIAVVGLLALDLSGRESLSGVSATATTVGAAMAAVAIARLAASHGRRPGLVTGYLVGALGALLAVASAVVGAFWLHVVSSVAIGWASAANLQARYAATDLAEPDRRAAALGTVVWATTVGAVLGPNLTGPGAAVARLAGVPDLAGAYLIAGAAFLLAAAVQLVWLRPDPLVLARAAAADPAEPVTVAPAATGATGATVAPPAAGALAPGRAPVPDASSLRAALRLVRGDDDAATALLTIAAAHGVMVGIMVMTPVHLDHHGAALQVVGLTISLHIAGMYAFSPLVGRLVDRIGRRPVLAVGLAQLCLAAVTAAVAPADRTGVFQLGLVLLGTGWSCCLIAGSTLLTDAAPVASRPAVQGVSDLVMNLAGAAAGSAAGVVLALAGYPALSFAAILLLVAPAWRLVRRPPPVDPDPAAGPWPPVTDAPVGG